MATPTLLLLHLPPHLSYLLLRRPLPYHLEVQCLLVQWLLAPADTLHLHHLDQEAQQLLLLLVLHLYPLQLVPPTPQLTRYCPLHRLRTRRSVMLAVICWLLYVWVRAVERQHILLVF